MNPGLFRRLLALTLFVAVPAMAIAAPEANTPNGSFIGMDEGGVLAFKGIRYAEAPIGSRRWASPRPVAKSRKPVNANAFGPACLQPPTPKGDAVPGSEDCLFLNVWTPATDDKLRPVMFWIHGGAFRSGDGNIPGGVLAAQDVVVVSINYRLGPLGFLSHPALRNKSANFAVEDMDLSIPASVEAFASRVRALASPVSILINSAGVMATPLFRDANGHEGQFATNHLGHYRLTCALWPLTVMRVETNRASGALGPKKSGLPPSLPPRSRWPVRPPFAVVTLETGMVISTRAADGFLGSSVSVPVESPKMPE